MYILRNSRSEGLHVGCKFSLTLRLDRAPRSQSAQCKRAVPVLGFISSSAFRCPARPHLSKLLCKGLKLEIGYPSRMGSCIAMRSSSPARILFRPSHICCFKLSPLLLLVFFLCRLSLFLLGLSEPAYKELSQVLRTLTYART